MTRLQNQSGFTMIEVLVASITIALSVAAIAGTFVAVEALNRRSRNLTIATQVAQQSLESYRNTSFATLTVGTATIDLTPYPSLGSPRSATAVITQVDPAGLDQVDVTVSWTESGKPKTVKLTTQIAQRGIDK